MLVKFKCPKCNIENSLSLADVTYQGVYRCWKCRELFTIRIEDNELKDCQSLTQEEFDKQQEQLDAQKEIEALKAKFKKSNR